MPSAEAAYAFQETRPGKRVALIDLSVEPAWQKERRNFRLIVRVTERTIDRHGQQRLLPKVSLDEPPLQVFNRYAKHGTHEQFHSEIKTDSPTTGCA